MDPFLYLDYIYFLKYFLNTGSVAANSFCSANISFKIAPEVSGLARTTLNTTVG